jgi:hypothetical protein
MLVLTADKAYCKNNHIEKKITVKLDYIPRNNNIDILNNDVLQKLIPELKEPKLFSKDDLEDKDDQDYFSDQGFSFFINGDFDNDGYTDIVFVIKGWDRVTSKQMIGFMIVSIKGRVLVREYFIASIHFKKAFLKKMTNYKQGKDAIYVAFALEGDWGNFLYWNGKKKKYDVESADKCCGSENKIE